MNEQLHARWEIVMNDVIEEGDIDTTCCQVCDNQEVNLLESELQETFLSCPLIHSSIYESALEASMLAKFI